MGIYKYRITVEDLGGRTVDPEVGAPLVFHASNHDNLLNIAARQQARWPFPADEAASLAIGLKLLSEVALAHRKDPLFAPLMPHLSEFIQRLKKGPESAVAATETATANQAATASEPR